MARSWRVSGTYIVGYWILSVIVAFTSAVAFIVVYEWNNIFGPTGIKLEAGVFVGLFAVMMVAIAGRSFSERVFGVGHKSEHLVSNTPRQPIVFYIAKAVHFVIDILGVIEKYLVEFSGATPEKGKRDRLSSGEEKLPKSIEEKRLVRHNLRGTRRIVIRKPSRSRSEPDES